MNARIFVKKMLSAMVRKSLEPWLLHRSEPAALCDHPWSVHTLVSERTWRAGVVAVSSLEWFMGLRANVFIHEDGSLSQETVARLSNLRPLWRLVRREEANRRALDELVSCPAFLSLYQVNLMAKKMADPWLWAPYKKYLYMDTDCLFLGYPDEVVHWAGGEDEDCWFLQEYETAFGYSTSLDKLEAIAGHAIERRLNAGLALWTKSALCWPRVEQLVREFKTAGVLKDDDWYIEQTLTAILFAEWRRGGLLPAERYITGYESGTLQWRPRYVACHYSGPTKYDRFYYHGLVTLALRLVQDRAQKGAEITSMT